MCSAWGPTEAGPGEQGEDVFERAQGAAGAEPERGGQWPGDQQRHHPRVGQRQRAVVAGNGAQLSLPIGIGGVDFELGQDGFGDAVQDGCLVGGVPVQDHRIAVQGGGEPAHRQRVGAVSVDDVQRSG